MILAHLPASIAAIGLIGYFTGMFFVFVFSPVKNAKKILNSPGG